MQAIMTAEEARKIAEEVIKNKANKKDIQIIEEYIKEAAKKGFKRLNLNYNTIDSEKVCQELRSFGYTVDFKRGSCDTFMIEWVE